MSLFNSFRSSKVYQMKLCFFKFTPEEERIQSSYMYAFIAFPTKYIRAIKLPFVYYIAFLCVAKLLVMQTDSQILVSY